MIIYDTPQRYSDTPFHRDVMASHVVSTLLGDAGTDELLSWAATVGLLPGYIQLRGAPREHFDAWGNPLVKLQPWAMSCWPWGSAGKTTAPWPIRTSHHFVREIP